MITLLPPVNEILSLSPEELAPYFLEYLKAHVNNKHKNMFHFSHILNSSNRELLDYAGDKSEPALLVLSECWGWLLQEGFLAPHPYENSYGWVFITRRGLSISSGKDFKDFLHISLLPKSSLDPILSEKIWSLFIRRDFDTAIFTAFKEVEIRIRQRGSYADTDLGVALARKAFNPDTGTLTDYSIDKGERQAHMDLFAGALGTFKSPSSHKDMNYEDSHVVANILLFANTLLKIIDSRGSN